MSPDADYVPLSEKRPPTCEVEMSRIAIRSDDDEYIYTISREEEVIHVERNIGIYNQEWFKLYGGF